MSSLMKEINEELLQEAKHTAVFLRYLAEIIQMSGMYGQAGNCIIRAKAIESAISKATGGENV